MGVVRLKEAARLAKQIRALAEAREVAPAHAAWKARGAIDDAVRVSWKMTVR